MGLFNTADGLPKTGMKISGVGILWNDFHYLSNREDLPPSISMLDFVSNHVP
jgi:hypothetical protein